MMQITLSTAYITSKAFPENTCRLPKAGLIFGYRLRCRPNIELASDKRFVFAGLLMFVIT